jgi:uncharacterized protein with PQ loop repeat
MQYAKNHVGTIIVLCAVVVYIVGRYVYNINGMNQATTDYDYCYYLSELFQLNSKTVFAIIYGIICIRTYLSKQYSKLSIWLFYISAFAMLAHFLAAGYVFDYVFAHVGADHMDRLPSMARNIFGAPAFFIILCFFFVPKLIKDTLKLKQEQELTI